MTDKELLEMAAKAAGILKADYYGSDGEWIWKTPRTPNWSPLTDDGDALRLAVKLNISVLRPVDGDSPEHWGTYAMLPDQTDHGKLLDNADPYAATRRAIVRAAAEIGKAMNA